MGVISDTLKAFHGAFDEFTCEIGEVTPEWSDVKGYDNRIQRSLSHITFNNVKYNITKRFVNSLSSRFCFSHSIFNFFTPSEVFERLQLVEPQTRIRVVTYNNNTCLGVTNPNKAYVCFDILSVLLGTKTHRIEDIRYEEGEIKTIHKMDEEWDINGDKFTQMFFLCTPIDGYGLPRIQLALKRESSGAFLVANGKVFKSEVSLGSNNGTTKPEIPLNRAISTFNNEEGFQAMRQRLTSACTSWASMNEINGLHKAMGKACKQSDSTWMQYFEGLTKLAGRVDQKYGIATMESISNKKARLLPMQCTIADAINFAIEIGSGLDVTIDPVPLYNWVGDTMSNEYDLEGTAPNAQPKITGNYVDELNKMECTLIIKSIDEAIGNETETDSTAHPHMGTFLEEEKDIIPEEIDPDIIPEEIDPDADLLSFIG